jgi:hypothetical protein
MNIKFLKMAVAGLVLGVSGFANAGLILQASDVIADSSNGFAIDDNLINKSGLSASYISQSTDFDIFVNGTTHSNNCSSGCDVWANVPSIIFPFNIVFSLGGQFDIESLALWNYGVSGLGLVDFSLFASNDISFSSSTLLGNYSALNPSTPSSAGQIFSFNSVNTSFVKMILRSNGGDTSQVAMGEVAFELSTTEVPEPSTLAVFALGLMGLASRRFKK